MPAQCRYPLMTPEPKAETRDRHLFPHDPPVKLAVQYQGETGVYP